MGVLTGQHVKVDGLYGEIGDPEDEPVIFDLCERALPLLRERI